jgi:hypothetical protein
LFVFTLKETKAEGGTSNHELRYEFECDGADGVYLESAFKWKLAGMAELAGAVPSKKANNWAEDFWGGGTAAAGDTTTAVTPTQPIRRILEQKTGSAGGAGQERQGAVSSTQGGLSDQDQYRDEQPDGLDPGSKMRFVV